jgi:glutathione S-transferase
MLELYHFYGATCGLKARLAVEEKGIRVTERAVERSYLKTRDYLALNPNGVVPTLVHDGGVLTESTVIINYLDDLSKERPLKPASPLGAARALWWMKRADDCLAFIGILTYTVSMRPGLQQLEPQQLENYFDSIASPALRARRRRIIELGYDNPDFQVALAGLRSMWADMERVLSQHDWLAGNAYSLGDIAIAPLMERLEELTLADSWRTDHPNLCGWWDRVQARPSYDTCVVQHPNPEAAQHRRHGEQARSRVSRAFSV